MVHEGSIIGSYRVVATLGEGGMGTVYLAEHSLLGRRAAIKVLKPDLSTRPDIIERFFGEARTASAIADPGIVQIFDFGYHPSGSAYILMELLDGEPLDVRLRRIGRLPVVQALRIVRQIASSLAAAHARGIVHRDLKPENVILVPDAEVSGGERAKLLDFGIAKLIASGAAPERERGPVMGTPRYMSPEQCRDLADLDHRSDIYSLGCVLFHLLTGDPPFEGDNAIDLLAMRMIEPPPVPSLHTPEVPPDVDALVVTCLAKSPRDRFQSMAELIAGIGLVLPHVAPTRGNERSDERRAEPAQRAAARNAPSNTTLLSTLPAEPAPTTPGARVGKGSSASAGRRFSRRPTGGPVQRTRAKRPTHTALLLTAIAFAASVTVTTLAMLHVNTELPRSRAQLELAAPVAPPAQPDAACRVERTPVTRSRGATGPLVGPRAPAERVERHARLAP